MTVQSARKEVSLGGGMSHRYSSAGAAALAMLAAVRSVLLAKVVAPYAEEPGDDRATRRAERRRQSMSWELYGNRPGDLESALSRLSR